MAVCIYYYQYNLYVYELCIFIRYLVSITQVLKDTSFGLDNWCESVNLSTFSCGMQEQETWYLCGSICTLLPVCQYPRVKTYAFVPVRARVKTCTFVPLRQYLCGRTCATVPVWHYLYGSAASERVQRGGVASSALHRSDAQLLHQSGGRHVGATAQLPDNALHSLSYIPLL
jgi:hypothetical protein